MNANTPNSDARMTVRLTGALTYPVHTGGLRRAIDSLSSQRRLEEIELDMKDVDRIDSAGIGECLDLYKWLARHGTRLRLVNLPRNMRRMLRRTGLDDILCAA